ncbi:MAG: CAAD domain-containing protein [Heteroscytonema crispum UTEX LB 1556]
MGAQLQQPEYINTTSPNGMEAIEGAKEANLPLLPPAAKPTNQWQLAGEKIANFFEQVPEYIGTFFNTYRQPLTSIALIVAAIIAVKVVLAILDAINDIPLISPIFELVGMSYAAWFTWRYLLKASTREELAAQYQSFKKEFVGE